ncbi:MAG TPA: hypothetical protein VL400_06920, partial [Polyangiaceae bacterium]|nr:hypothetical protein [Polyangiaceae bacterium]
MDPIRDAAREAFARRGVGAKLASRARAVAERDEAERRLAEARGLLPWWAERSTRRDVTDVTEAERQLHVAHEEEARATEALSAAVGDVALELPLVGVAWTVEEGLVRLLRAQPGHFEAACREEASRLGDAMDEIRRLYFPEEALAAIFHASPERAELDFTAADRADPPMRLFISMLAASQLPSLELSRVFETLALRQGASPAAAGAGVRA